MRKYILAQESFCLQGILNDINEQDTSFLDCKHKHMMKCGAPPDKFGVLYRMFTYRIPWFHKQNEFQGLSLFSSWSYLNFFIEGMGPFKDEISCDIEYWVRSKNYDRPTILQCGNGPYCTLVGKFNIYFMIIYMTH